MKPPKHIALVALAVGAVAVAFVAIRMSRSNESDTGSEPGTGGASGSAAGTDPLMSGNAPGKSGRPSSGSRGESGENLGIQSGQLSELGADTPPADANAEPVAGPLQKLFEMKTEGVPLFDENYALSEQIKEALGLSDSEYLVLNQRLAESMEEIDEMREQNLEVRSSSDSQFFVKIRSFGEKGAEVRAALQADVREQLGEERYSAFMMLTENALESEYFQFGKAYQTISYNFYDSQNTGSGRVRVVDEVHIPQGDGQWTVIRHKDNYDTLPERYVGFLEASAAAAQPLPEPSPAQPEQTPTPEQAP